MNKKNPNPYKTLKIRKELFEFFEIQIKKHPEWGFKQPSKLIKHILQQYVLEQAKSNKDFTDSK